MSVWFSLVAGLKAFFGPTAEEQEANELCSAFWLERAQQDRRRLELDAVVLVTEGRRG